MNIFTIIVSLLLIVTKYLDCITTLMRIKNPYQERNKLARKLMFKFGIPNVVWAVMALTVLIVLISVVFLFTLYNRPAFHIIYVVLGLLISIIQASVAHYNYTGNQNIIIRFIAQRDCKSNSV